MLFDELNFEIYIIYNLKEINKKVKEFARNLEVKLVINKVLN